MTAIRNMGNGGVIEAYRLLISGRKRFFRIRDNNSKPFDLIGPDDGDGSFFVQIAPLCGSQFLAVKDQRLFLQPGIVANQVPAIPEVGSLDDDEIARLAGNGFPRPKPVAGPSP